MTLFIFRNNYWETPGWDAIWENGKYFTSGHNLRGFRNLYGPLHRGLHPDPKRNIEIEKNVGPPFPWFSVYWVELPNKTLPLNHWSRRL